MQRKNIFLAVCVLSVACCAQTITVSLDGSDDYTTIQAAIDAATDGDEVIVADGTYIGDGNRDIDFLGKAITVRSANGPDTCIINCQGRYGHEHRAFNFRSGEGAESVLDGFTIVNGKALREDPNPDIGTATYFIGGAIFCIDSSPTINNCIFKENGSQKFGGAIGIWWESSPNITNCIFEENEAESGGAIYLEGYATIENCKFYSNTARRGGALRCFDAPSVLLSECEFVDNVATDGRGGAIHGYWVYDFLILDCEFTGNCAYTLEDPLYGCGGAIYFGDETLGEVVDCVLTDNYADNKGGAIYSPEIELSNSCFTGNSAGSGGALYSAGTFYGARLNNCIMRLNSADLGACVYSEGLCVVTNSTLFDNTADSAAGVLYCAAQSSTAVTNTILRQNTADDGPAIAAVDESIVTISYNNIEGGLSAVSAGPSATIEYLDGNIDAEVDFAFPDDLHLMAGSACIDAGTNEPVNADLTSDFDANPRPLDGDGDSLAVADMGAFEFNPDLPSIALSETQVQLFVYQLPDGGFTSTESIVQIRNCGSGSLDWQVIEDCPWLQANPSQGTSSGEINEISFSWSGVEPAQNYTSYLVQIFAADAVNTGRTINVSMSFKAPLTVPEKYPTIQAAVDAAHNGDTVIVADGTYTGYGNRDINFLGKAITVRSQNGPENCIIDCQASEGNWHRVFNFVNAEDANSILDGFTITNGYMPSGGGICTYKSDPVIRNCVFKENTAYYGGGGAVVNDCGKPVIENCVFLQNTAFSDELYFAPKGGAIFNSATGAHILNCIFLNNLSEGAGGAVFNGTEWWFGIPYAEYEPEDKLIITNCVFAGNTAGTAGGAICNTHVVFAEPYILSVGCNLSVINSTFTGNLASETGGLWCSDPWPREVRLTNNIFWANVDAEGMGESAQIYGNGSEDIQYCCIQGWTGDLGGGSNMGEGNMGEDPLFIAPGSWDDNDTPDDWNDDTWIEGDYHLQEVSPCIDSGDPNYITGPDETDLDGNPRVLDGNSNGTPQIDMGAYEYVSPVPVEVKITPNTLSIESKGKFFVCHISLPLDISITEDNINSILLEDNLQPDQIILDHKDNLLTAKFDRALVTEFLTQTFEPGPLELCVTIKLDDGTILEGKDTITNKQ